jgi:chromosome segregation ATPase
MGDLYVDQVELHTHAAAAEAAGALLGLTPAEVESLHAQNAQLVRDADLLRRQMETNHDHCKELEAQAAAENAALRARNADLTKRLSDAATPVNEEIETLRALLKDKDNRVAPLLQANLDTANTRATTLRAQLDEANARLTKMAKALNEGMDNAAKLQALQDEHKRALVIIGIHDKTLAALSGELYRLRDLLGTNDKEAVPARAEIERLRNAQTATAVMYARLQAERDAAVAARDAAVAERDAAVAEIDEPSAPASAPREPSGGATAALAALQMQYDAAVYNLNEDTAEIDRLNAVIEQLEATAKKCASLEEVTEARARADEAEARAKEAEARADEAEETLRQLKIAAKNRKTPLTNENASLVAENARLADENATLRIKMPGPSQPGVLRDLAMASDGSRVATAEYRANVAEEKLVAAEKRLDNLAKGKGDFLLQVAGVTPRAAQGAQVAGVTPRAAQGAGRR